MAYDHYLRHQPNRGTGIVSWILLMLLLSFFAGFFVRGAIGRAPLAHSLGGGAPTENALPTDSTPASSGASGSAQPLW
jgi:hypothetical protein